MKHSHRLKEKRMAYILHFDCGYTKASIATLMKISPQQMGAWITEMGYEVKIHNLYQELNQVKEELIGLGYSPQKTLNSDDFN